MRRAMMLCLILITISIEGCAPKPCPSVPQKCRVPYTELPEIDNTICPEKDYKCIHDKGLKNYEAQKKYADTLRNNSEVCR